MKPPERTGQLGGSSVAARTKFRTKANKHKGTKIMKKLMIAAAVAAMIGGVQAALEHVPQVYNLNMTVKTTVCKNNKSSITDKMGNTYSVYRAQTSYKFEGLFWGCGCAVIANPIEEQYARPWISKEEISELTCDDNNNSWVIWGKNGVFENAEFSWTLLQLVGKKHENIEGYFTLKLWVDAEDEAAVDIAGAGYGTAKVQADVEEEGETYSNPQNYISSMSGNLVGLYNIVDLADVIGCAYCGVTVNCYPVRFCNCGGMDQEKSAAFGTWTIKHNSGLAKKIGNGYYITEAYKFSDSVKALFTARSIEAGDITIAE